MDTNSLMFLLIGIAISAALFAVLVFFYPQITERRVEKATAPAAEKPAETSTEKLMEKPAEKTAEEVLRPFLFYGICCAYRTAERAIYDGHPMMWGTDKRKIADSVYDALPAQIDGREASAIKSEVSKEQFGEMVQRAFDEFDKFCNDNKAFFDQQFEAWKQEHPRP
jgi:hypothetical protein